MAIREEHGRFLITDLSTYDVEDVSMALNYFEKGNKCRSTARTCQNQTSSRSHAIFNVNLTRNEGSTNNYETATSPKRASVRTMRIILLVIGKKMIQGAKFFNKLI